jgi:hypothetical protein
LLNRCDIVSGEPLFMNPITGIAACCARATNGHAAIAPTEQRDEIAAFQLIESHSVPSSQGAFQDIELAANS